MISVCLASYNGSKYIESQIRSILCQLNSNDELILVDDCSADPTVNIVKEIRDPRIKIYCNNINKGVIKSFEKAIELASGDIIFLSDQDDIWYSDKVREFVKIYNKHPEVTLVLSDARVVDENRKIISDSFYKNRGKFIHGVFLNIIKNKYLGCTMSFKSSIKQKVLPIPEDIPMHDMWIGIINAIYGKSYFIIEPMMDYRRHKNNVSPASRSGLVQMTTWRWKLIKNLFLRLFDIRLSR